MPLRSYDAVMEEMEEIRARSEIRLIEIPEKKMFHNWSRAERWLMGHNRDHNIVVHFRDGELYAGRYSHEADNLYSSIMDDLEAESSEWATTMIDRFKPYGEKQPGVPILPWWKHPVTRGVAKGIAISAIVMFAFPFFVAAFFFVMLARVIN